MKSLVMFGVFSEGANASKEKIQGYVNSCYCTFLEFFGFDSMINIQIDAKRAPMAIQILVAVFVVFMLCTIFLKNSDNKEWGETTGKIISIKDDGWLTSFLVSKGKYPCPTITYQYTAAGESFVISSRQPHVTCSSRSEVQMKISKLERLKEITVVYNKKNMRKSYVKEAQY